MAEKENAEQKPIAKKGKLKLIIIAVLVIILGAGAFLGWRMFLKKDGNKAQNKESSSQSDKKAESATYTLDTFIVNLQSGSGSGKRYLKAGMVLNINNQLHKALLDKNKPQIRDAILIFLSSKTSEEIGSIEGKMALKQSLIMRMNQILGKTVVDKIYFSEFVVQ